MLRANDVEYMMHSLNFSPLQFNSERPKENFPWKLHFFIKISYHFDYPLRSFLIFPLGHCEKNQTHGNFS